MTAVERLEEGLALQVSGAKGETASLTEERLLGTELVSRLALRRSASVGRGE